MKDVVFLMPVTVKQIAWVSERRIAAWAEWWEKKSEKQREAYRAKWPLSAKRVWTPRDSYGVAGVR